MKKSLLALAVMGALSGSAFGQMVIFGKIDQSVGKNLGTKDKAVMDNAGSRIAFRGYEPLSATMGVLFMFEHRFNPDTGTQATIDRAVPAQVATFWDGFALVGLRTGFGTVTAGRQYTSSFQDVQTIVDPFAGEGVGALRNVGAGITLASLALPGATAVGAPLGHVLAGPAKVRVNNSIKYSNRFGPVSVSADIAENPTVPATAANPDKPMSVAVTYTAGPLWAGLAYENPQGSDDDLINLAARYTFGITTLSGMYSIGSNNATTQKDITSYLIGAKIKVGAGDIKVGVAGRKTESSTGVSTTNSQRLGLGYDHHLSKRSKVYAQFGREGKLASDKTGYEVGIQHNF